MHLQPLSKYVDGHAATTATAATRSPAAIAAHSNFSDGGRSTFSGTGNNGSVEGGGWGGSSADGHTFRFTRITRVNDSSIVSAGGGGGHVPAFIECSLPV